MNPVTPGNPNIRVEATDDSEIHCFRVSFNAKASPYDPERASIEVIMDATDLVDLIHKASAALSIWQKDSTQYLLRLLSEAHHEH